MCTHVRPALMFLAVSTLLGCVFAADLPEPGVPNAALRRGIVTQTYENDPEPVTTGRSRQKPPKYALVYQVVARNQALMQEYISKVLPMYVAQTGVPLCPNPDFAYAARSALEESAYDVQHLREIGERIKGVSDSIATGRLAPRATDADLIESAQEQFRTNALRIQNSHIVAAVALSELTRCDGLIIAVQDPYNKDRTLMEFGHTLDPRSLAESLGIAYVNQ